MELKKFVRSYWFILFIWILIYSWYPLFLGFYLDDWSYIRPELHPSNFDFFAPNIFNLNFFSLINRPVLGIIFTLCCYIAGNSNPVYWQVITQIIVLLTAFSLNYFSIRLFRMLEFKDERKWAVILTGLWLIHPVLLPFVAWPLGSMLILSPIFSLISFGYLIDGWNKGKKIWLMPLVFYLLACFSYESFYFQFFVIFIIAYAKGIHKKFGIRYFLSIIFGYFTINLLSIVWNRVSSLFSTDIVNKEFNPYFLQTIAANFFSLPYAYFVVFSWFSVILICFIIYLFIKYRKATSTHSKPDKRLNLLIILSLLFGMGISIVIYSGAGYTLWSIGPRARTLAVVNIWFLFLLIYMVYYIYHHNLFSKTIKILSILSIAVLVSTNLIRANDWIYSWQIQKDIISAIPHEKIKQTKEDCVIIFDGPFRHNGVPVIDADWLARPLLNYGIRYLPGKSFYYIDTSEKRNYLIGRNIIHSVFGTNIVFYWDGKVLIKKYDEESSSVKLAKSNVYNPEEKYATSEVWVWKYETGQFYKVEPPAKLSFEPQMNYDYWLTYIYLNYIKKK
ncbi:MAG: hypothetical protein HW421_3412 [Ignavibacteria bacterium]|nr:hypothetical protein [Ignavibacteria bacterium]